MTACPRRAQLIARRHHNGRTQVAALESERIDAVLTASSIVEPYAYLRDVLQRIVDAGVSVKLRTARLDQ
jgi:hypothetical protein